MQNELPEWAVEQATELADEVFDACVDAYEGHDGADYTAMIARALVAAERRGIEGSADAGFRAAQHVNATADDIAAAIRQLGKNHD